MRVVLCKVSAWERVDEDVRVDCLWAGVESMDAIMREVSAVASGCETKTNKRKEQCDVRPAVIAFWCPLGRTGPTAPCCASKDGGSSL